ncbi:isopentenyl-diphosphate Delta-isomerase [archaeon]|nr:isopentenyl-diphosphate Delta-isomerase [archaeon]MBT6820825.1 isopentenyl-diphosphate Delta-isomerase [archaeon]MBT7393183.1 isopentenyl-diphosphate Delta-isomerase [archaeon]
MKMDVILVDKKDKKIGTMEKIEAHKKGLLHRAFSIFVFNSDNELLLQKRADSKYHSPGLWTNTCCSHPMPNSTLENDIHKRLKNEMGFDCELKKSFTFIYKTEFENGLIENEFDHVFIGCYDDEPKPNPDEVSDYKWINLDELKKDIIDNPNNYTYWLKKIIDRIKI